MLGKYSNREINYVVKELLLTWVITSLVSLSIFSAA